MAMYREYINRNEKNRTEISNTLPLQCFTEVLNPSYIYHPMSVSKIVNQTQTDCNPLMHRKTGEQDTFDAILPAKTYRRFVSEVERSMLVWHAWFSTKLHFD
jgi:hypothetical protein